MTVRMSFRALIWRSCLAVPVALLLAFTVGCGSKGDRCWVSGQVLLDGKPIPEGSLRLDPVGESASPGALVRIVDGKYSIPREKGLVAGKYHVRAYATRATGKKIKSWEQLPGKPAEQDEVIQYLPDRYSDQSQIVINLTSGENTQDFQWTSK